VKPGHELLACPALDRKKHHTGTLLSLICAGCDRRDYRHLTTGDPTIVARFYRPKGWDVDDRLTRALCPDCARPKRSERDVTKITDSTAASLRRQREMFDLFNAQVDPDTGRYCNDWTDHKVAVKVGLAETFVAQARVACFGEPKPDPALVRELAEARAKIDADAAALKSMVDNYRAEALAVLDKLSQRIVDARARAA
jgi:hypothetical protein